MDQDLIRQYQQIHARQKYGRTSVKNGRYIRPDIRLLNPQSVIDYGCGQSKLIDDLRLGYPAALRRYDPAIPAFSQRPSDIFDLLLNVDVLEHIREPDLDSVIEEMRSLCRHAVLIVDTVAAKLILPSGENAHVTIRPKDWWAEKLGRHFPHLVPIRVESPRRAAFRTWDRPMAHEPSYRFMSAQEHTTHHARVALTWLAERRKHR